MLSGPQLSTFMNTKTLIALFPAFAGYFLGLLFKSENGRSMFLQNDGKLLPGFMLYHPTREHSSVTTVKTSNPTRLSMVCHHINLFHTILFVVPSICLQAVKKLGNTTTYKSAINKIIAEYL